MVPLTDQLDRFSELKIIKISKGETTREYHPEGVRKLSDRILLKLKEINTPEETKLLVDGFIEIEKEQSIKPEEGSYFVFDLIGLEVVTTHGDRIGQLTEVMSLPANDVYIVQGESKEYRIPATKDIVRKIDLVKKEMIIEPMEGLLEI